MRPRADSAPGASKHLVVPFFADDTDQCGPSVLASVLSFWGRPATPAELKKEAYLAELKGTLPMDLLLAAKGRGMQARLYDGGLEDVRAQIDQGRPVIAFINRGPRFLPLGHYVVVNGYDDERGGFIVHSGLKENLFVPRRAFMKDWDKTRRTTLLILPPAGDKEPSPHET